MDEPGQVIAPGPAIIRRVPLFAALPDDEIQAIWSNARRVRLMPGDRVIEEEAPGDALFIVLSGEVEVTKREGGRDIALATRGPGQVIGEMALLDQTPRTASVRALQPSELIEIDAETFGRLIEARPATATLLLKTVAERLRSTESLLVQSDKLASLGTLAAGLAHELNNPAAAIQRSGTLLREAFASWRSCSDALGMLEVSEAEHETLVELEREADAAVAAPAGDRALQHEEQRLIDWLEARGIAEPWDVGPVLAAYGFTLERVEAMAARLSAPVFGPALHWLSAGLSVRQLLDEIQMSSRAISRIVEAVKSYSYLDRAPVQNVDIRQSLEDTLVILAHKLRHGIDIVRDIAPDLPAVEAYAGELNQVWTNIIDNAVQAMDGKGTLTLAARPLGGEVEVRIVDSGPGIPPDVRLRVFEPFFTTKPQGVGTGLGLHIAHNIVVNHHHGRITFTSQPGRTEFRVVLPVRLSDGRGA